MTAGPSTKETATLAGGCFWCLEAVFLELRGVESVRSGYAGGSAKNPTYEEVCSGKTGHTEAVLVVFDPAAISLENVLRLFWEGHDPTQGNRQGNDVGTQYRSAIFVSREALGVAHAAKEMFQVELEIGRAHV